MRIERISQNAATGERQARSASARRDGAVDVHGDERLPGRARGTALVAIDSPPAGNKATSAPSIRPTGAFVTQLLANRLGLAQTRTRRKLSAEEASTRYGAADGLAAGVQSGQYGARSV